MPENFLFQFLLESSGSLRGSSNPLSLPDAHFNKKQSSCLMWMSPKEKRKLSSLFSLHPLPCSLVCLVCLEFKSNTMWFICSSLKKLIKWHCHASKWCKWTTDIPSFSFFLLPDTPLLVRSSSDSALAPPFEVTATPPPNHHGSGSPVPVSSVTVS